jgi:hypothetical protein
MKKIFQFAFCATFLITLFSVKATQLTFDAPLYYGKGIAQRLQDLKQHIESPNLSRNTDDIEQTTSAVMNICFCNAYHFNNFYQNQAGGRLCAMKRVSEILWNREAPIADLDAFLWGQWQDSIENPETLNTYLDFKKQIKSHKFNVNYGTYITTLRANFCLTFYFWRAGLQLNDLEGLQKYGFLSFSENKINSIRTILVKTLQPAISFTQSKDPLKVYYHFNFSDVLNDQGLPYTF